MDWSDFFNKDRYSSDLTIRTADQDIKVHKNILCVNSRFFKAAIGPGSKFKEANLNLLELKDDDPKFLYEALSYMYNDKYEATTIKDSWFNMWKLFQVADKYGMDRLCEELKEDLIPQLTDFYDAGYNGDGFADILRTLSQNTNLYETIAEIIRHDTDILEIPETRELLVEHPKLALAVIDKIAS